MPARATASRLDTPTGLFISPIAPALRVVASDIQRGPLAVRSNSRVRFSAQYLRRARLQDTVKARQSRNEYGSGCDEQYTGVAAVSRAGQKPDTASCATSVVLWAGSSHGVIDTVAQGRGVVATPSVASAALKKCVVFQGHKPSFKLSNPTTQSAVSNAVVARQSPSEGNTVSRVEARLQPTYSEAKWPSDQGCLIPAV